MGFLYILQSNTTSRFYVGSTDNLERRVKEHEDGKCISTRNRGPWTLVYSEKFNEVAEARGREYEIKRWKSENESDPYLEEQMPRAGISPAEWWKRRRWHRPVENESIPKTYLT
jgi:putative endonuclease